MKSLIVEGWRFIPHSYAMVNQHQCLELLRRPGISLYHRDVPFASGAWKPERGLFTPAEEAALAAIPAPLPAFRADAVLRMGWPHHFHPDPCGARTFVWATSETLEVHDLSIGDGRPAREALPRITCRVIACSRWAADGFANSGAARSRLSVVPCGVDPEMFGPAPGGEAGRAELRRKLGWEGRFVVLNVSAMTTNKGIGFLMKAMARLAGKIPDPLLVLKGSDALYTSEAMAKGSARTLSRPEAEFLLPRIHYTGSTLPTEQIVRFMQGADLYVSPYLAEGFNLPVLEAAACGLPVVCTRGGSTDDFTNESWCLPVKATLEDTGSTTMRGRWLVPDMEHVVEQVQRGSADAPWRESARAAGPEWVRSKFTWKHSVDRLLNVIFPEGV